MARLRSRMAAAAPARVRGPTRSIESVMAAQVSAEVGEALEEMEVRTQLLVALRYVSQCKHHGFIGNNTHVFVAHGVRSLTQLVAGAVSSTCDRTSCTRRHDQQLHALCGPMPPHPPPLRVRLHLMGKHGRTRVWVAGTAEPACLDGAGIFFVAPTQRHAPPLRLQDRPPCGNVCGCCCCGTSMVCPSPFFLGRRPGRRVLWQRRGQLECECARARRVRCCVWLYCGGFVPCVMLCLLAVSALLKSKSQGYLAPEWLHQPLDRQPPLRTTLHHNMDRAASQHRLRAAYACNKWHREMRRLRCRAYTCSISRCGVHGCVATCCCVCGSRVSCTVCGQMASAEVRVSSMYGHSECVESSHEHCTSLRKSRSRACIYRCSLSSLLPPRLLRRRRFPLLDECCCSCCCSDLFALAGTTAEAAPIAMRPGIVFPRGRPPCLVVATAAWRPYMPWSWKPAPGLSWPSSQPMAG